MWISKRLEYYFDAVAAEQTNYSDEEKIKITRDTIYNS